VSERFRRATLRLLLFGSLIVPAATARATPTITVAPPVVLVGSSFQLGGNGFTRGSLINFFVATATGAINAGPLVPSAQTPSLLTVPLPVSVTLGQGVASIQVVNTDENFIASNVAITLLQGFAAAGIPSITGINGVGLSPSSTDPGFAVANVDTVVTQGLTVQINGAGFDTDNGVAVDLFCACAGGKVGPFFLDPKNPGLTATKLSFVIPAAGFNAPTTGPGSLRVSNRGADPNNQYRFASNAVSVPIGAHVSIGSISQTECGVTVNGGGFSVLTVINLFTAQGGGVVNLGGLGPNGQPRLPLSLAGPSQFTFAAPAVAGAQKAYVQALNPPFVPSSTSGDGPSGAFTLSPCSNPGSGAQFAYVANSGDDTISAFTVDTAGGQLQPGASVNAGAEPVSIVVDPPGRFAYAANLASSDISIFSIDGASGALTPAGARVTTGRGPETVTLDPAGKFLYTANFDSNDVWAFAVNSTSGALTPVAGSPFATRGFGPLSMRVAPAGRFAYVTNFDADSVSIFAINSATGALTLVGNPVSTPGGPYSIAIEPSGRFAYIANIFADNISAFAIDAVSGLLTRIGQPTRAGDAPISVVVEGTGRFAYVANQLSGDVFTYSINSTTGALTQIGAGMRAGSQPMSVAVDSAGRFVYVANASSGDVSAFAINFSSGALTPLGSAVRAGAGASAVVTAARAP
jgi:6-phosphogluconolactonase